MIAAIYSRKSKFTGKGESIENQIQLCMEYAKNLGITDFLIYEDEGFSGWSTNRPRFQEMLQDAKNKKFNYLICYRLDRISRNVSDFSTLIEELNKLDISFISIKEQFDTSTPMGRAMMYISSVFAQLERETIAERIKDNMYELARTGRWLGGTTPLGFTSTQITYYDENMAQRKMYQLEEDPESMDTVKLIFDKYLELKSLTKLYKYLYNAGIRGSRDGKFSPGSVSVILRNAAYVKADENVINYLKDKNIDVVGNPDGEHGILTYAKNTSSPVGAIAKHKGIIDSDKWIQVQSLLDKNKDKAPRAGTGKALLSGLLKCSKCGANMRYSYTKTSAGNVSYYYICGTKKLLGVSACNCKNIKADVIEDKVIDEIKNTNAQLIVSSYRDTKLENNKNNKEIESKTKNINSNIKEKQNIIDTLIMQLGRNTDSSASTYIINKIEELNKEIENLKKELDLIKSVSKELNTVDLNIDLICDSLNKFANEVDTADLNKKRLLLSNIVDYIEWIPDEEKVTVHILGLKKK
ncbi:recombinase family protein [Romboutsia sp. 1001713B170207_170306_H8]|uniref:recombinase family protein n=1 Tax=Romboutsia sp. 1001713B170207_170306_H8 TaxID=2787112 RepID=UPI0018988823|nr:recombinase family protein [Romboutsia sp. 1001713B170207_170306_H8]